MRDEWWTKSDESAAAEEMNDELLVMSDLKQKVAEALEAPLPNSFYQLTSPLQHIESWLEHCRCNSALV